MSAYSAVYTAGELGVTPWITLPVGVVVAGLLGASMIGLVGALYGYSEGFLAPAVYSFTAIDILVLITLTLGGLRTLLGPIVGAVLVFWIDQFLAGAGGWRTFVFGVLLVVLFLYFREGVVPKVANALEERGVDLAGALSGRS